MCQNLHLHTEFFFQVISFVIVYHSAIPVIWQRSSSSAFSGSAAGVDDPFSSSSPLPLPLSLDQPLFDPFAADAGSPAPFTSSSALSSSTVSPHSINPPSYSLLPDPVSPIPPSTQTAAKGGWTDDPFGDLVSLSLGTSAPASSTSAARPKPAQAEPGEPGDWLVSEPGSHSWH